MMNSGFLSQRVASDVEVPCFFRGWIEQLLNRGDAGDLSYQDTHIYGVSYVLSEMGTIYYLLGRVLFSLEGK